MIDDPDRWAPMYAEAGGQSVTFHIEAARDPRKLARDLRAAGARAGPRRGPSSPYEELLPELDMVLVMTVEPGFGGQSFMADQMLQGRAGARPSAATAARSGCRSTGSLRRHHRAVRRGRRRRLRGRVGRLRAEDAAAAVDELRALAEKHRHRPGARTRHRLTP